jgi:hypothetical protein
MISEKLSHDYLCVKRRINQVESDKYHFNAYPKAQYSSLGLKFVRFRAIVPKNMVFSDTRFMGLPAGSMASGSLMGDHTLGCCSSSRPCGPALRVSES